MEQQRLKGKFVVFVLWIDQGQLLRKDQGRGNSMLHIVAFGYFEYLLLGTAPSSPLLIFRRNLQKLIFLLSYPNNE